MKNILRTAILFLIITISACNPCGDVKPYLSIENMHLEIRKLTGEYETYGGGIYSEEYTVGNSPIAYDSLLLNLTPTGTYFGAVNYGDLFVSSAYALSCAENGNKGTKEHISDIAIWSDSLFTPDGNVEENLAKYFTIRGYAGNEFISTIDLVSFLSTQPPAMTELYLSLKDKPTASKKHRFTIVYKQTNGKEFQLITPEIEFE